jgi:hypothetical protein
LSYEAIFGGELLEPIKISKQRKVNMMMREMKLTGQNVFFDCYLALSGSVDEGNLEIVMGD